MKPTSTMRVAGLVAVSAALFTACATVPPAKSVASLTDIAGKWEGTASGAGGSTPVTMTVNPGGTYSTVLGGRTFTGKISLEGGKLRGRSNETGNTGTWSLHEGDGRRVLVYNPDRGGGSSRLTPVK